MDYPVQEKVKIHIKGCQGCKWHEAVKYDWMEYERHFCHEPQSIAHEKIYNITEKEWINGMTHELGLPHQLFISDLPDCFKVRANPALCGATARYYKPRHNKEQNEKE